MKPNLEKIRDLLWSADQEDFKLGFDWLKHEVGEDNALANWLVMQFKHWWCDNDIKIADDTYTHMKMRTHSICYGKNYAYNIDFIFFWKGEQIIDSYNEYSRYAIGDGRHLDYFLDMICRSLRKRGIQFYNELHINIPKPPEEEYNFEDIDNY